MTTVPALTRLDRTPVQDELARQHEILDTGKWQRILLAWFGFGLCAFYVNPFLLVVLAVIDTFCELVNLHLLKGLDPPVDRGRYRVTLYITVVMEFTFIAAAGLVWQVDDPYAKAWAAGMVMTAALQLTTVRSIHLAYGFIGFAAVTCTALVANAIHWAGQGSMLGFLVSSAAGLCGIGYSLVAMLSNHDLHRTTAAGRAAALASDAAKGRFLAQMSHELRTPLNAIIGLGQVELAASQTPESRMRLETLVASASGLAVVLDDVLDLSSITDGRVALRPRVVDVRAELAIIVATFKHQARAMNITLNLDCMANLPAFVVLDPQRMRQCLINLLSNALKHVSLGGILVTARYEAEQLVVNVSDSGPGIPEALHEAIFEPFRKLNATAPGIGLGLAITRGLARQMKGDLVLLHTTSGATFRLTLPAAPADEILPLASSDLASMVGRMAGRSVLVVDDIATNRLVATSFLQGTGARVIEADGGQAALDILAREAVDLVLLDMNMPDLDGFSTFRAIRGMGGLAARTVVTAMTADVLPIQLAKIAAQGLDGCLTKPLSMGELHALLKQHFGD